MIEDLSLLETEPGRFVRTARLSHAGAVNGETLEYEIVHMTILEAGRLIRQVNELAC